MGPQLKVSPGGVEKHGIELMTPFYTPPLKKVRGIMLYPPKKICVRVSVRPSVCPSVFRFRALS